MNRNLWLIFIGICLVALAAVLVFKPGSVPFNGDPAKVVADDHVFGNASSPVVLIEYGDFQCPGCGSAYPVVNQVKEKYKDQIAFVYRYLPLTTLHPNAKAAAAAAEAAGEQGKFWQMYDKLYSNQDAWSSATPDTRGSFFEEYAQQLGLDMTAFKQAVSSSKVLDRIARDQSAAQKAGIALSTPTFVLNGRVLNLTTDLSETTANGSSFSVAKFSQTIDAELKKFNITPPADSGEDTTSPTKSSSE